jgi:hypothetical protein
MPAQTTLTDAKGERLIKDEDLWALVHYVRSVAAAPAKPAAPGKEEGGH